MYKQGSLKSRKITGAVHQSNIICRSLKAGDL